MNNAPLACHWRPACEWWPELAQPTGDDQAETSETRIILNRRQNQGLRLVISRRLFL